MGGVEMVQQRRVETVGIDEGSVLQAKTGDDHRTRPGGGARASHRIAGRGRQHGVADRVAQRAVDPASGEADRYHLAVVGEPGEGRLARQRAVDLAGQAGEQAFERPEEFRLSVRGADDQRAWRLLTQIAHKGGLAGQIVPDVMAEMQQRRGHEHVDDGDRTVAPPAMDRLGVADAMLVQHRPEIRRDVAAEPPVGRLGIADEQMVERQIEADHLAIPLPGGDQEAQPVPIDELVDDGDFLRHEHRLQDGVAAVDRARPGQAPRLHRLDAGSKGAVQDRLAQSRFRQGQAVRPARCRRQHDRLPDRLQREVDGLGHHQVANPQEQMVQRALVQREHRQPVVARRGILQRQKLAPVLTDHRRRAAAQDGDAALVGEILAVDPVQPGIEHPGRAPAIVLAQLDHQQRGETGDDVGGAPSRLEGGDAVAQDHRKFQRAVDHQRHRAILVADGEAGVVVRHEAEQIERSGQGRLEQMPHQREAQPSVEAAQFLDQPGEGAAGAGRQQPQQVVPDARGVQRRQAGDGVADEAAVPLQEPVGTLSDHPVFCVVASQFGDHQRRQAMDEALQSPSVAQDRHRGDGGGQRREIRVVLEQVRHGLGHFRLSTAPRPPCWRTRSVVESKRA